MQTNPENFRQAMAMFPGAVTVVTTGEGDDRRGMTATAVCSVTDDPPSLLVCINRKAETGAEITRNGRFCVQLLNDQDHALALRFAGTAGLRGAEKFEPGRWKTCSLGMPRLEGARAALSCVVTAKHDVGSHRIFVGEIRDIELSTDGEALVYVRSAFRSLMPQG
ncbi:flavin reductase family protein [Martelella soudanensis]|uniref:flavin reductase family protein n=1 Tax=unclassified Martelella TaxID=2629616 RepID=UPI0015DF09EE|nr:MULTISPECIES: flavin reductase family protein [unclassified Martelella]